MNIFVSTFFRLRHFSVKLACYTLYFFVSSFLYLHQRVKADKGRTKKNYQEIVPTSDHTQPVSSGPFVDRKGFKSTTSDLQFVTSYRMDSSRAMENLPGISLLHIRTWPR